MGRLFRAAALRHHHDSLLPAPCGAPCRQADTTRDQEYTFTPVVNPKSQKLMARSQELPAGFLERQQYLAALAAEKKELYRSLVEEAECRGQPQMRASTSGPMDKGSWSR